MGASDHGGNQFGRHHWRRAIYALNRIDVVVVEPEDY
jgi:hypothetical protein